MIAALIFLVAMALFWLLAAAAAYRRAFRERIADGFEEEYYRGYRAGQLVVDADARVRGYDEGRRVGWAEACQERDGV